MSASISMDTEPAILEETPEQAAQAISRALNYLQYEAIALGMFDVGDLIDHARVRARQRAVPRRSRRD